MAPYLAPFFNGTSYNCALCGAFAQQSWHQAGGIGAQVQHGTFQVPIWARGTFFSTCSHCQKQSIWIDSNLVYPQISIAPMANPDMPEDVLFDYKEASNILQGSPSDYFGDSDPSVSVEVDPPLFHQLKNNKSGFKVKQISGYFFS